MASIHSIEDINELCLIKNRWEALQENCFRFSPYITFEWYSSALKTIDKDKSPYVLIYSSEGRDFGLAPLVHKKMNFFGRNFHRISFVNNLYTQFQGFLYESHFERIISGLMNKLIQDFGRYFILDLNELRLSQKEKDVIQDFVEKNNFVMDKKKKPGCINLVLRPNFEETVQSLRRQTQKEFRRKIKRLDHLGQVSLTKIQGPENIKKHLDHFFRLREQGWKGEEPHPKFLYDICKEFEKSGKLFFYALQLGDEPLSYLICLQGKDVMYGVETTYNPKYAAYSPGIVLFYRFIENLFTQAGIKEFDLGRGEEQY